jgi:hypothetical protein
MALFVASDAIGHDRLGGSVGHGPPGWPEWPGLTHDAGRRTQTSSSRLGTAVQANRRPIAPAARAMPPTRMSVPWRAQSQYGLASRRQMIDLPLPNYSWNG